MKTAPPFELPPDMRDTFRRATRLEWWSLLFMCSCVPVVYFTLGQSQAMRAVLIQDVLGIIPSAAFLMTARIRWRTPSPRFPYGYQRSVAIGFLTSAVSLVGLGALILFEALRTLLMREHPTVGVVELFGRQLWLGWLMFPALIYCLIGEYTFGRLKQPYALALHDKTLASDARMNRADWMTGVAAILGITGLALGWWWADAVTAAIIAIEVLHDGWANLKQVIADLMDEVPTKAHENECADWAERLLARVRQLDWVREADVRLREEGHIFTGEVYVVPRTTDGLLRRNAELQRLARELDWRFHDLALVAVDSLSS